MSITGTLIISAENVDGGESGYVSLVLATGGRIVLVTHGNNAPHVDTEELLCAVKALYVAQTSYREFGKE